MEKRGYFEPKVPFAEVYQAEVFTTDSPYSCASFDAKRSDKKNSELGRVSPTRYPGRGTPRTRDDTV